MNKSELRQIKTRIAGFKMGMMQKIAEQAIKTEEMQKQAEQPWYSHPAFVAPMAGLGGAGLGVLGKSLYDKYYLADKAKGEEEAPYIDEQAAAEVELTPQEYMQLMALYSSPYGMQAQMPMQTQMPMQMPFYGA